MTISIRLENGVRTEAVLLAGSRDRLRLAVPGSGDTNEIARSDGEWRDENGRRVEIEAIFADSADDAAFWSEAHPLTLTAGGPRF